MLWQQIPLPQQKKQKPSPMPEKQGITADLTSHQTTIQNPHRSSPKGQLQVRFLLGVLANNEAMQKIK